MKRIAVLAALAFALMGPAGAKPTDAAPHTSSAETAAAARPAVDSVAATAGAAPAGGAPAPRGGVAAAAGAAPGADREFYALMGAALLAIGALFWRRRGSDDEA